MGNRDDKISILSDSTRRDILSTLNRVVWLYGEEIRVLCELHLGYKASQPVISRHLSMLVKAGMIKEVRENIFKKYSINREAVNQVEASIEGIFNPKTQTGRRGKGVQHE